MSQDIYLKLQATKQVPVQNWVIQRTPILVGKEHIDARKPTDFSIWLDSAAGVSDTEVQKFWADAAGKYGYSSEWDQSWVRGSVAIALNGGAIDHDISVRIKRSVEVTCDEVVKSLDAEIQRNSRRFPADVGVVGLLRPLGSAGTRPGFSVLISGPHGGSEDSAITFVDTDEQSAIKEISRLKEPRDFSAAEICARYLTGDEQLNQKPAGERAKSSDEQQ